MLCIMLIQQFSYLAKYMSSPFKFAPIFNMLLFPFAAPFFPSAYHVSEFAILNGSYLVNYCGSCYRNKLITIIYETAIQIKY